MPDEHPSVTPYPLLFEPTVLEKVWGGRRLGALGKRLAKADSKYGESWELADMGSTSASGAGGGAVRTRITNGELRGKSLNDAMTVWGDALIRRAAPAPGSESRGTQGGFPLLVKFLDADENLSVQVHPSPTFAAAHAQANLKTECWYIVEAAPGSVIYKGIKPGVSREEFSRLARAGDARLVDALVSVSAVAGDCHNLPSGTVHALGAGVMVAEVQTPSDTTFRLYDWGRTGRELHVEAALECASFPGEPGHEELLQGITVARIRAGRAARLVTTEFFTVDELRPDAGDVVSLGGADATGDPECVVLIVLEGVGELVAEGGGFEPVAIKRGDTALVPAAVSARTVLAAGSGTWMLRVGIE